MNKEQQLRLEKYLDKHPSVTSVGISISMYSRMSRQDNHGNTPEARIYCISRIYQTVGIHPNLHL